MSMKEKLAVTVLVTTLALFGLVVVLYRMIKDKNEDYTQIVLNQHSSYDSRTIPYRRGDIVDRNGTYLATSEKVYNLILDPNQINQDKENYLEPTVSALCEVFGYDRADILATISANENSYYVPYEKQISADKKEEFETKKKELNDAYAKSKEDSGKKIKIELYPEIAPISCENFEKLVKQGFYDGLIFHRVIPGFMIQGGCPDGTGMGGPGWNIKGEFAANGVKNDLKHTRGVLSMARAMNPNSAGSQFFIMHEDAPHLDGQYAAFGKVVEGMDVVDEIASVQTDYNDKPMVPQVMKKVTIED